MRPPTLTLYSSSVVQVGDFRCDPSHPDFDGGATLRYLFVFPRTAVWIEHEGRPAFVADTNTVPVYNPGHPYRRRRISHEGDRTDWFAVSPDVLRDALRLHDPQAADHESRLFHFDYARVPAQMFMKQREVYLHARRMEDPNHLYIEESVVNMLDGVLAIAYDEPRVVFAAERHRDLAEAAKSALNVCYSQQTGLTDLARSVGTSVFHLCRVFRHHTGMSLHRYRSELRLRKSLELLDDDGDDILAIAIALGYSGHSHFTGAFHRAFGMPPSQYRDATRTSRRQLLDCDMRYVSADARALAK